jgi:antitoxin (DNA-binding transcriptional repressor) of toxin-antitoxin stability system
MLTMLMVNIAEAKAKLSEFVEAVSRGERVVICNRNKPVAELRAVDQAPARPRDLSPMYPGQIFVTDGFFEPMTEAELREWYRAPVYPATAAPTKVAERQSEYATGAKKTRRK